MLPEHVYNRVHFVNWGKHKATNKFSHVSNVILAGTLFLRPSQYEARKRVSTGLLPEHGDFTPAEMEAFKLGESADYILQALCRGTARLSDGDGCPPCHAYIIAAPNSGIAKALPAIFPECKVRPWLPIRFKLDADAKKAFVYIRRYRKRMKKGDRVKFTDITKATGLTKERFKYVRRDHPDFNELMLSLGLEPWAANVYYTAYVLTD